MAYGSLHGRKPLERASKISHSNIINNPDVQAFLTGCAVPRPAEHSTIEALLQDVPMPTNQTIRAVVAVDGSYRETAIRNEFPSAVITFFAFGPLLFKLEELRKLDKQPFIAPEDLAKLKNIQRFTLVLPTRNISREGQSLKASVRSSLHDFFIKSSDGEKPLIEALRWIIFRGWKQSGNPQWVIPTCPNEGCTRQQIVLTPDSANEQACTTCGAPIYMIDALRLHERVDEEQGAGGITMYVMTMLEHIVLVHLIKALWELKPDLLQEILFIKDGQLAFFGQTAPLSKPMRELAEYLGLREDQPGQPPLLNAVGLEKSGPFVEHAIQIESQMRPGTVLLLSNEYIYKYIVPGDPNGPDPYGSNTYWGGKLIYKAKDNNVYVATVPTIKYSTNPKYEDFLNLTNVLAVLGELRCSMYDNALIPVALANRLISLSYVPSSRILETFARANVDTSS
jgi:hypothetical protein